MPFTLPDMSREEAATWLIEHGQLSWEELGILRDAAAGVEEGPLNVTRERAAGMLARWSGPIPGLKLVPLRHWQSAAIVRGGAPLDMATRRAAGQSPFGEEPCT